MRLRPIALILVLLFLAPTVADARQLRLRTGDLLQCEIIGEQSDENYITIRLFSTGGVFRLNWDQLIAEDETMLREELGLTLFDESEIPQVPGHKVIFGNGSVEIGLAENPDDTEQPLILKTPTGTREYPREHVAVIKETMVEALSVYSVEELYQRYLAEVAPEAPSAHVELADRCVQIGAYDKANSHYLQALDDADFAASDQAAMVKNRLKSVAVFLRYKGATDQVMRIKKLLFQKRFDTALEELNDLLTEYEDDQDILKLLKLDRLETQITTSRRKYFVKEVHRRFYRTMDKLVNKKVREKEVSIKEVVQWVQNPKGLAQEIFTEIANVTGLEEAEARELWEARTSRQVHRYNYGTGTFIHPEVQAKGKKSSRSGRSRRPSGRSGRSRRGGQAPRQQQKPKSADEWWDSKGRSAKSRENFCKAWFAEFANLLTVLRFEKKTCTNCGGKGILISHSAGTAEEIKTICPVCNLAGFERIVICR